MENKNEINKSDSPNKYWIKMQSPIFFASSTFVFSIITASIFYSILNLTLNFCSTGKICSIFLQLNHIPLPFFDTTYICIQILLYTIELKKSILFSQILKISSFYSLLVFVRMIILWNLTPHNAQTLYYIFDILSSITEFVILFFSIFAALKIINVCALKFYNKSTKPVA